MLIPEPLLKSIKLKPYGPVLHCYKSIW